MRVGRLILVWGPKVRELWGGHRAVMMPDGRRSVAQDGDEAQGQTSDEEWRRIGDDREGAAARPRRSQVN